MVMNHSRALVFLYHIVDRIVIVIIIVLYRNEVATLCVCVFFFIGMYLILNDKI